MGSHVIITTISLTVLGLLFAIIFVSLLLDNWLEARRLKHERLSLMPDQQRQPPKQAKELPGGMSELVRLNPDLIKHTRGSLYFRGSTTPVDVNLDRIDWEHIRTLTFNH